MYLKLKSVGSVIDTETQIVYASYSDEATRLTGKYFDPESGVPLQQCNEEWVDTLSEDDIILINEKVLTKH